MPENFFILLLVACSITFGLQNDKLPVLTDRLRKVPLLDRMLSCSYCTGYHAGWITWILLSMLQGLPAEGWHNLPSVCLSALASAITVYSFDMLLQALERHWLDSSE